MEEIRNSNKLIFTRYNMYKMLMLDYPKYRGNDDWSWVAITGHGY